MTLNNPEKRNMLSGQMLAELVEAMKRRASADEVRAVVLTGAGDKVFCAGADLGGFAADASLVQKHFASDLFLEFFRLMPRLGKPSLCAANGHVLAGGMGLALSCDLLIAKEGATFGTPEINVGAFPYMIMSIIYRNVPRKKVNEMMLLGERLSAEQAVEFGLANKVVPAAEFDAAVADWAGKLASKSPVLMRLGHDAMYRQQDMARRRRARVPALAALAHLLHRGHRRGRHRLLREARSSVEGQMSRNHSFGAGEQLCQARRHARLVDAHRVAAVGDGVEEAVGAGSRASAPILARLAASAASRSPFAAATERRNSLRWVLRSGPTATAVAIRPGLTTSR